MIDGTNPIPQGFISLYDYSRKHGYDLVDLVVAKDRDEILATVWTLKLGRGTNPQDIKATIVREDMIPPADCRRVDYGEIPRQYSVSRLAMRLGRGNNTVHSYLKVLRIRMADCKNDEQFDAIVAKCERLREQYILEGKVTRYKGKCVTPPEGYASIRSKALEWGLSSEKVYSWIRQGRLEHKWSGSMVFVPADTKRPDRLPHSNQWLAAKAVAN